MATKIQNRLAEIQARSNAASPAPWFDGKYSVNDSGGFPICCQFTNDNDKRFMASARKDIPFLLDLIKDLYRQLDEQKEIAAFVDTLLDDNIRIGDTAEKIAEENEELKLDLKNMETEILRYDPATQRILRPVVLDGDAAKSFCLAAELSECKQELEKYRNAVRAGFLIERACKLDDKVWVNDSYWGNLCCGFIYQITMDGEETIFSIAAKSTLIDREFHVNLTYDDFGKTAFFSLQAALDSIEGKQ